MPQSTLLRATVTEQTRWYLEHIVQENKGIILSMDAFSPRREMKPFTSYAKCSVGTILAGQNLKSGSSGKLQALLQPIKDLGFPGDLDNVQLVQMILNFTGADALGIECDDLVLDPGFVRLMLPNDGWFKLALAVPWNCDLPLAVFAVIFFLLFPLRLLLVCLFCMSCASRCPDGSLSRHKYLLQRFCKQVL